MPCRAVSVTVSVPCCWPAHALPRCADDHISRSIPPPTLRTPPPPISSSTTKNPNHCPETIGQRNLRKKSVVQNQMSQHLFAKISLQMFLTLGVQGFVVCEQPKISKDYGRCAHEELRHTTFMVLITSSSAHFHTCNRKCFGVLSATSSCTAWAAPRRRSSCAWCWPITSMAWRTRTSDTREPQESWSRHKSSVPQQSGSHHSWMLVFSCPQQGSPLLLQIFEVHGGNLHWI